MSRKYFHHESQTAQTVSYLVNISSCAHVVLQILPACLVCKISDVHTQIAIIASSLSTASPSSVVPFSSRDIPPISFPRGCPPPSASALLTVLPDKDSPSLQISVIQVCDRISSTVRGGELNKAASFGSSVMTSHDFCIHNFASLAHVVLDRSSVEQ